MGRVFFPNIFYGRGEGGDGVMTRMTYCIAIIIFFVQMLRSSDVAIIKSAFGVVQSKQNISQFCFSFFMVFFVLVVDVVLRKSLKKIILITHFIILG